MYYYSIGNLLKIIFIHTKLVTIWNLLIQQNNVALIHECRCFWFWEMNRFVYLLIQMKPKTEHQKCSYLNSASNLVSLECFLYLYISINWHCIWRHLIDSLLSFQGHTYNTPAVSFLYLQRYWFLCLTWP